MSLKIPAPLAGEVRSRGAVLWWHSSGGEWRVVPAELWVREGEKISWRRSAETAPFDPRAWDVVYTPLTARGIVMAVRVVRATTTSPSAEFTVRGVTVEGVEVTLSRERREVFADPVEAALEIGIPPRLDAVVEFAA